MSCSSVKAVRQALVQLSRRNSFAIVNKPCFMAAGKPFSVTTRVYRTLGDAIFRFKGEHVALFAAFINHKDLSTGKRAVYLRFAILTEDEFKRIDREFLTDELKIEVSPLPDW